MNTQPVIHAESHFFPLLRVKVNAGGPTRVEQHIGTAFFIAPTLLMTCWHCVASPLEAGYEYAIRVKNVEGGFSAIALRNIERDRNGTDMATAYCPLQTPQQLSLANPPLLYGEEVWTFGYPYPETRREADGSLHHVISGRFLRGYMTRNFYYDHPTLGKTDAYELDMKAPLGTSGAAILRKDSLEVVGLIFGVNDVETVEEFARVDPVSGTREPEVRRVASFALAYDTEALSRLTTGGTNSLPLATFLRERAANAG